MKRCSSFRHLYDANNNYVKTACRIDQQLSQPEAYSLCNSNQMRLFSLTDKSEVDLLFSYLNSIYPQSFGASFWLNGVQKNGIWYSHVPHKAPIDDNIDVIEREGTCLMASNSYKTFGVHSWTCIKEMNCICEFQVPTHLQ
jgi:hypothetical protein